MCLPLKFNSKKVMSCLYWLIYFKWLYVGNVKIPQVLTEWRSGAVSLLWWFSSALALWIHENGNLYIWSFIHSCTATVRVRKIPEQMPRHWVLRLVRTHWLICFFISTCFTLSVLQERPSSCTSTDSFSHRVFELSFICKLIMCHLFWPQKLGHIDILVQCVLP